MTTVEVLKAARARIEKGWCQHAFAIDANGEPTDPVGTDAVAWCARGAICDYDVEARLSRVLGTHRLSDWNDSPNRDKADVLALFNKAIALAEKETA